MAGKDENCRRRSPFGQLYDSICEECRALGIWNSQMARDLPKRWEKHGDMVLLAETAFASDQWRMLGRNLWKIVAESLKVSRVGRKRRIEPDDFRTPHVELMYGDHGWVEHVDNSIRYQYDVTKCMYSIGNISEKLRIAQLDCRGEVVIDLFAGIGYFTLPYLVHARAKHVHACEWNPDALEALRRNLALNHVVDRCTVYEGDCRRVCPVGIAQRVNLGLLPSAHPYWLTACKALHADGGVLHIHECVTSSKLKTASQQQAHSSRVTVSTSPSPSSSSSCTGSSALQKEGSVESATSADEGISVVSEFEETVKSETDSEDAGSCDGDDAPKRKMSTVILQQYNMELEREQYTLSIRKSYEEHWNALDAAWQEWALKAGQDLLRFLNHLHDEEWTGRIHRVGKVKSYAPRIDHVVLDVECKPSRLLCL